MNRTTLIIVLCVVAAIVAWSSFFVIDETELAIVTQFGAVKRSINRPGLHFKSPVESVDSMERRIMGTETPAAEYLTLDKKRLVADPITRWRIVDPNQFYISFREENVAKVRLDDIINSELRREIASHDFNQIVGKERDTLMAKVTEATRDKTKEFGIEIVDIRIKRADLPNEVQESVFARMRAERDRVAKQYRSEGQEEAAKIRADTDKEKTILLAKAYETSEKTRGEGDGESIKIYADAFGKDPEFYAFVRSLSTYEKALDEQSTVVLSTGSELFKYLMKPAK